MQQCRWISPATCWTKETRHKREHSIWFYSYKCQNWANISVVFQVRLVARSEEDGRGTRGNGFLGARDILLDLGSVYTGISILWKRSEVYISHLFILVLYVMFQLKIKMGPLEGWQKNLPFAFLLFVPGEFSFDVFKGAQVDCIRKYVCFCRIIRKYMLEKETFS